MYESLPKAIKEISTNNPQKEMEVVKIGNQTWMGKDLDVEFFSNGDQISQVINAEEWIRKGENEEPAWCYYDNDPSNGKKFGKLYNWFAINDSRGLAPKGWRIPSKNDWNILIKNLGGGGIAGNTMKGTELWLTYCGNNESGFNALPSGVRAAKGVFGFLGEMVVWWSSSDTKADTYAVGFDLSDYSSADLEMGEHNKSHGYSVRCLKEL